MTGPACDLDRLNRMAMRTASPDEVEAIRDHLDDCAGCAATLRALLAGDRGPTSERDLLAGTRLGRFTIGGVLGRGNMGTVFTARDPELDRDVAVKVLGAGRVDARYADRLVREAKAMAQVRHINVVTVHEVDRDQDVIFVAMELIRGSTLRAALASARPPTDVVLDWLLQIAHGLDAIHAAGLIHRDLKPDNIFVEPTASGYRVVVGDLGLAGASASEEDGRPSQSTSATSHAGTPAYMAPEQRDGQPATRRTDVFAFGVTAWEALTGRRPDGVLKAPGIADELIAILAKAMAPRPDERYASAHELADELQRFQRGERVAAHAYSAGQLLTRWIRAHRAIVAVAGVAIVAILVLGAISLHRILDEQQLTAEARDRAEAHRSDAEELMAFLLTDMHEKLAPLGKLELLEAPARKAIAYYDRRAGVLDDRDRRALAAAHANLGAVLEAANKATEALAENRAALAIRRELVARAPGDRSLQRLLAMSHGDVGQLLAMTGDIDGAIAEHRAGQAIVARIAAAAPTDLDALRTLSTSHNDIGLLLRNQHRFDDALVEMRAALPIAVRVAAALPEDAKAQRDVAMCHDRLGSVLDAKGEYSQALVEYRAALAITAALAAKEPNNTLWQNNWATSINRVGDVLMARGDGAAAVIEFRAALAIREQLAAQEPRNGMFQQGLWVARIGLANGLQAIEDYPGAIREYRRAVTLAETNAAASPDNAMLVEHRATSHYNLGAALLMSNAVKDAVPPLRTACEMFSNLTVRAPSNARWESFLATCRAGLGEALLSLHDVAGAIAAYRDAIAIFDAQRERSPEGSREGQVLVREQFAEALEAGGRTEEALAQYRIALADAEAMVAQEATSKRTERVGELRARLAKLSQAATSKGRAD